MLSIYVMHSWYNYVLCFYCSVKSFMIVDCYVKMWLIVLLVWCGYKHSHERVLTKSRGLDETTRPTSVVKHYLRGMWFHASYTIVDDRGNTGMGMEFTSICKNSHREGVILAYYPRKAVTSYAMLEIGTDCGSYTAD